MEAIVGFAGVIVGAFVTALLTHRFNSKLLEQQLAFHEANSRLDAELRKALHHEAVESVRELRQSITECLSFIELELKTKRTS